MKRGKEYSIYSVLLFLFILTFLAVGQYSTKKIDDDISYHGKALSSLAWNLDFEGMEEYLVLAVNSYSYGRVQFYDKSTDRIQVDVAGKALNKVDSFFNRLGVLRIHRKKEELFHNGDSIGELEILFYNHHIYFQFYILLVFILFFSISYLIVRLVRARESLEARVRLRTTDLQEEITGRQKVEEKLRLTLDSIGDGVISTDDKGLISSINPVARNLIGISMEEASGQRLEDVLHLLDGSSARECKDPFSTIIETGGLSFGKDRFKMLVSRTGEKFHVVDSGAPIRSARGELIGTVIVLRDVSGVFKLQKQLEHSQRMDAVGQLAGGIAHDFNNVLGGIMGSSELLDVYIEGNENALKMNHIIQDATERAARLIKQLLAFSRKNVVDQSNLDLHEVVAESVGLLEHTIDKRIEISRDLRASCSQVTGDISMLQSIIINMGINASHAISGKGSLRLATKNVDFDESYCQSSPFSLEPGHYIELSIEDNGSGMPETVVSHIFEPFFTTKPQGKGTGLGLSTVYGTVKQHGGEIRVYSEEGEGTTFYVSLPLAVEEEQTENTTSAEIPAGSGTVLVVDDVDIMRITAEELLKDAGYNVITAEDGLDALHIYSAAPDSIDLVLLDLVMPRMGGRECFQELRKISPGLPVILSSGFVNSEDYQFIKSHGLNGSIVKPYRGHELKTLVYDVLLENRRGGS